MLRKLHGSINAEYCQMSFLKAHFTRRLLDISHTFKMELKNNWDSLTKGFGLRRPYLLVARRWRLASHRCRSVSSFSSSTPKKLAILLLTCTLSTALNIRGIWKKKYSLLVSYFKSWVMNWKVSLPEHLNSWRDLLWPPFSFLTGVSVILFWE